MIARDYTFAGALTHLPIIYGFAVPAKAFTKLAGRDGLHH